MHIVDYTKFNFYGVLGIAMLNEQETNKRDNFHVTTSNNDNRATNKGKSTIETTYNRDWFTRLRTCHISLPVNTIINTSIDSTTTFLTMLV